MTKKGASLRVTALLGALAIGLTGCSSETLFGPEPEPGSLNTAVDDTCNRVNIVASSEKAALMAEMAESFNDTEVVENCNRAVIYTAPSGEAMDALAAGTWTEDMGMEAPDVWSPASTSWLRLLSQRANDLDRPSPAPLDAPSVTSSPLVIAMPEPMAKALGWPEAELGWSDILSLSTDAKGWGSVGHGEWGAFKLGKTNPNFSTSGLNATIGTYYAATGLSSDLQMSDIDNEEVRQYASDIESAVVHYGDTTLTFLSNMLKADQAGESLSYVSAVTLEEKSVWDYNQGNPTGDPETLGDTEPPSVPLVAVYPKEGTLNSDSPYALLEGDWVDEGAKTAAAAFLEYLQSPESQSRFQAAGFRNFDGEAGEAIKNDSGLNPALPSYITPPNPQVLSKVLDSWKDLRKGARVLLVVDTSGSMDGQKIMFAKEAVAQSLELFSSHDQVGLASFSSGFSYDVPVKQLDETHEQAILDSLYSFEADGDTFLYGSAIESANIIKELEADNTIDAVVILSDGEDSGSGSLKNIEEYYQNTESDLPRLFTVAYGDGADTQALSNMSEYGEGAFYKASDPSSIKKVMTSVISNF